MESLSQQNSFSLTPEEKKSLNPQNTVNINIGVLGHIDSGKTSLARALSEVTSTASLDKNPQSQERKITLDLGFSAFYTKPPMENNPEFMKNLPEKQKYIQFTLVDCPGHASLIRTIIGGASIIDIMFLVIDINKGIQTQTAECLVIGELLMQKMIVILNKVDMIPEEKRKETVEKKKAQLKKIFSKTKFGADVPMLEIAAAVNATPGAEMIGINNLVTRLQQEITYPERKLIKDPFLFLIDHCFPIKGQGSVVTGTVVQGQIKSGEEVYFPQINETKKTKSMQMFKKNVNSLQQGDRAGILFTQLDPTQIERGIACNHQAVQSIENAIIPIKKINYFKFGIKSKGKYHITSGHQTIMANIRLFSRKISENENEQQVIQQNSNKNLNNFDFTQDYEFEETYEDFQKKENKKNEMLYCLLEFERPIQATQGSLLIGSKFDSDITQNVCRLGFSGIIISILNTEDLKKLKICRYKFRTGIIEKVVDSYTVLIKNLFKKETNIDLFLNKPVIIKNTGNEGKLSSAFGKSGKVKATFPNNVNTVIKVEKQQNQIDENGEEQKKNDEENDKQQLQEGQEIDITNTQIIMPYQKFLFNKIKPSKNQNNSKNQQQQQQQQDQQKKKK